MRIPSKITGEVEQPKQQVAATHRKLNKTEAEEDTTENVR